jgi:glyoxylase-like metal-dependent hydrolase (beta-lactamase superfamily II)
MKPVTATLAALLSISALVIGCSASSVETAPARLGKPAGLDDLLAVIDEPGPIVFEKHLAADWLVPLSGLLNLDNPRARAAGIEDREEPIQIYTYSLRHPAHGTFIVDSGVSRKFVDAKADNDVSLIVRKAMNISALEVKLTTWKLAQRLGGIDAVLLTHIHMDHIMGLTDLDRTTPVYSGPGEAALTSLSHLVTRGTTDRLLAKVDTLQEWQFGDAGIVDILGDGTLWAIHSPGHTPGSTAYLARTTTGSHLMIGDATHTRWGWENGVEPGTYSADIPLSAISLARLKQLAQDHPELVVHPGHQAL